MLAISAYSTQGKSSFSMINTLSHAPLLEQSFPSDLIAIWIKQYPIRAAHSIIETTPLRHPHRRL